MSAAVDGRAALEALGRGVAGLGPAARGRSEVDLEVAADLDALGSDRRERLAAVVHGVQRLGQTLDEPQPLRGRVRLLQPSVESHTALGG